MLINIFFQNKWNRNGLKENEIKINKNVILSLIRYYTREAGVRGLERQIAKILRKVVKERLVNETKSEKATSITPKNLKNILVLKNLNMVWQKKIMQLAR